MSGHDGPGHVTGKTLASYHRRSCRTRGSTLVGKLGVENQVGDQKRESLAQLVLEALGTDERVKTIIGALRIGFGAAENHEETGQLRASPGHVRRRKWRARARPRSG
jgi:hypothetical protein